VRWALVSEIDATEVFEPINRLWRLGLMIFGLTTLSVLVVSALIAQRLTREAERQARLVSGIVDNTHALASASEELTSVSQQMSAAAEQTTAQANLVSAAAEQVSGNTRMVSGSIDNLVASIHEIAKNAQDAAGVARRAVDMAGVTSGTMDALGRSSIEIGAVVKAITSIAEQTNLLALNAAIIAAQAGEHGKGFAVVADEIKDLAERAGSSTREIADLIKTIQAESKNAIAAVERGTLTVDRGVVVSADAERALKKILESSQKSTNMVRAIARATVEQARGSKQVTDSIGRIAETVQQIATATSEQARGSELIMKGAEKMRQITQQVERSAQEQARGGRQITAAMENISGMVQQLHGVQRAQSRGGEQTLEAVQRIQGVTRANARHLRALAGAAERLQKLLGTQPPGTS
jgi:methyl-accepting chemotaxis protein